MCACKVAPLTVRPDAARVVRKPGVSAITFDGEGQGYSGCTDEEHVAISSIRAASSSPSCHTHGCGR